MKYKITFNDQQFYKQNQYVSQLVYDLINKKMNKEWMAATAVFREMQINSNMMQIFINVQVLSFL